MSVFYAALSVARELCKLSKDEQDRAIELAKNLLVHNNGFTAPETAEKPKRSRPPTKEKEVVTPVIEEKSHDEAIAEFQAAAKAEASVVVATETKVEAPVVSREAIIEELAHPAAPVVTETPTIDPMKQSIFDEAEIASPLMWIFDREKKEHKLGILECFPQFAKPITAEQKQFLGKIADAMHGRKITILKAAVFDFVKELEAKIQSKGSEDLW